MTIYDSNNQAVLTVEVSDESYAYNEIMGDKRLHLEFELPTFVEIPVGSHVTFHFETYYLLKPESLKLVHRRNWEYVVEFEGLQEVLKTLVYQNPDNYKVEFPVTGKASDHLTLLKRCINAKDSRTWDVTADSSLTLDKCINYSFNNCKEALQAIADAFETEWEVKLDNGSPKICVGKVEYYRNAALSMSYGKNNGLRSGIERKNYNDEMPLTTIYVKGDDRNISYYVDANGNDVSYGSKTLHLPTSATGGYDGTYFSWENNNNYDSENAMLFAVSSDGFSVSDSRAISRGERNEGILDCTDIYPKYEGTVTRVDAVDVSKNLYDFYDNAQGCPNFKNLGTPETMTVIFQNGMLAGREFDVNPQGSSTYGMKYEIVPAEQDGIPMPGGSFVPVANETKYIIFHCKLPYQYINDPTTHTGAEWDMLKTAVKYLWEARMPRYSISGELDPIWSNASWATVGDKIKVGGYVSFTDPDFQSTAFLIRIQSVRHYVNKPHQPEITLSNTPSKGSVASTIRTLERDNYAGELRDDDNRNFTKRTYASAKATMEALAQYFSDYSDYIKPVGIQTMQMLVGDERLQLEFSNSSSDFTSPIRPNISWSNGALVCPSGGYVRNVNVENNNGYSQTITTISGNHTLYVWPYPQLSLTKDANNNNLDDAKQYYLYLIVTKNNNVSTPSWKLYPVGEETSVLDFEEDTKYNFLVGILNTADETSRDFVPVYGFTEITPGGITTDMIRSSQGNSWLNLLNGTFSWSNGQSTSSSSYRGIYWDGSNFKIQGDVTITGGSGLEYVDGYSNLLQASTYNAFLAGQYVTDQNNLQGQIDGKIQTWYQSSAPTWSSSENAAHVGDLWYNTGTEELKRYSANYTWDLVDNSAAARALAQSKKQVFSSQPTVPYAKDDLWINDGKLYYCIQGRTTGSFDSSEWAEALDIDFSDKASIQREWQKIHGRANFNAPASGDAVVGSYWVTKAVIDKYDYGTTESTLLDYNGYILTYSGDELVYQTSGTADLDNAYNALKDYLVASRLYEGGDEWLGPYDAATFASLLATYYSEETGYLAEAPVSEFQYLKDAMPDGANTQIGGGVVLSQFIAVKDANENVVAGLNGDSANNRWPMLWAGSANASSINNALWQVDGETGVQKSGTSGGAMIETIPQDSRMIFYNTSGYPSTIIDGQPKDLDNYFGSNTSITLTGNANPFSHSQSQGGSAVQEYTDTVQTITASSPGTLVLPTITLTSRSKSTGSVTGVPTLKYKIDGNTIGTVSISPISTYVDGEGFTVGSGTITGKKAYLSQGSHIISISSNLESVSWDGTLTVTSQVSYSGSQSGNFVAELKVAHLSANGIILGSASDKYMLSEVISSSNSTKMKFELRSGDAGVKVYDGAIQMTWNGGTTWYNITRDSSSGTLKATT